MPPPVLFPDTVATVINGLRPLLVAQDPEVTVAARVPGTRSFGAGPLVLIRRVGGESRSVVFEDVQLTVEAWADEAEDAQDLCQLTLALIRSLAGTAIDDVPIYVVADVGGPAYTPDPESEQPRYTATIAVTVRGAAI